MYQSMLRKALKISVTKGCAKSNPHGHMYWSDQTRVETSIQPYAEYYFRKPWKDYGFRILIFWFYWERKAEYTR